MFSFLTKTVARLATPLIYPIIAPILRPANSHAVGYFQPIEAEFDCDYDDDRVVVAITKVIDNVDIVGKQIKAVVKAPIVVTSRVVDKSIEVVTKLKSSARETPVSTASQIVKDVAGVVKPFVPYFLLSGIRTYSGTKTTNNPADRWWIKPKEPKAGTWHSIDQTRTSSFVRGTTSSAYPSTPPSCAHRSFPRRNRASPLFDAAAPTQETDTITAVNLPSSAYSPDINSSPRSEGTVSSLELGSTISSLDLRESLDSLSSLGAVNGLTNGNGNGVDSNSSSGRTSVASVEVHPAISPVDNELTAPSEISLSSPCASDLSEIRLPLYSPSAQSSSNNIDSDAENFSDNEEDTVNRARAIAFRSDHEETDRLDSSLEQIPQ
ncbi:hypothetical protein N0V85_004552 [Neurospora sp. IMI 360204]|nr:hypothetical protein N0V85_004552 [Neurospora sp. IMI 360204]